MPKGRVLKAQSRQLALKLHEYFEQENQNGGPLIPITQVRNRVAAALGISLSTVTKITTDAYGRSGLEQNKPSTPKRKRRAHKVTAVDDFDADAIRRHVYDYYLRKEIPTLRKLIVSLKRSGLFHGEKSSLVKVLNTIGFSYKKSNKRKLLMERTDIGHAARCNTSPPFTANKMLQLLKNACTHVTAENWASVVERTKRVIFSDWERDIAFDNILSTQELIITVTEDSSSEESSVDYHSDDSC